MVRKQSTPLPPPPPQYARLPALPKTIEELSDATLRRCLATLCTKSASDAKHIGRILIGDCGNAGQPKGKENCVLENEADEGRDAIELLLDRALVDRRRQLESGDPMLKRKRSPIENEEDFEVLDEVSDKGSESQSTNDEKSSDSSNGIQKYFVQEHICQPRRSNAWQVDETGLSGKCSSYAYSRNPHCVQRTDKVYIEPLRARLDVNPSMPRESSKTTEWKCS